MNDTTIDQVTDHKKVHQTSQPIVNCTNLKKSYSEGTGRQAKLVTEVLKGVDLTIAQGEQVAILGQSGSGKSTLLHLMGMLDEPTEGQLFINNVDVTQLSDDKKAQFRNQNMGFIYQFHHLLTEFSALENVAMPLLISGVVRKVALEKAKVLLEDVGLGHRLSHNPSQMSGGERQRVAIARALVNNPSLVLADEPTGNLDKKNAEHVFDLFLKLNQQSNTTLVVVTHDLLLAERFDRIIQLDDGVIV
ncbi:lipoprotein-releasing ABC transporter ATP-binding protein LolD [Psychrosphaera sp. B3R10]|uniref:lipoprotein-releasing ABC transporter ATP-binding protein LolD n=1 Tax=unclassified Psychrosphaera TaxID=2641570 RepID=UPI001C0A3911|nr:MULTISPECIES: lipoprotein-releasing ABC transporter ATP-binding protein LolD [unclassified Psychrosphaera]MBU2881348.1 lipoprotein-releasing ABC transporter ATP-binding protein LolD [Psychrosphaera sp. I2R16]MBU2988447.1 lipoprotein-releasing ABC transporter ATP-binding protein LolD [Psychrosphaera sp. B3R10]MDO6720053.1 lipoprotein-releasing ABC transporter ATP-binding protein LolD [Psychrosphaera sp. 1_MG-2023]